MSGLYVFTEQTSGLLQLYIANIPVKVTEFDIDKDVSPQQLDGTFLCRIQELHIIMADWIYIHSTKVTWREPTLEALEVTKIEGPNFPEYYILKNSMKFDNALLTKQVRDALKILKNKM